LSYDFKIFNSNIVYRHESGVKQTSERAIEFAKALSGGDPSKAALLKDAIEKGYKAAEKAWGGELPEICKQTQEATLKGLDDWANKAN